MRKILTTTLIIIVCIAVAAAAYFFVIKRNLPLIQATSPNILYLTNPVTLFSGKIEAVSGNILTVSQDMILSQPSATGANPATPPSTKKITYQIQVTNKTLINQTPDNIPYLFKKSANTSPTSPSAGIAQLQISSLKAGQFISVSSAVDLRTLIGNQFEALNINVSPEIIIINGKITNISGNNVSVSGTASVNNALPVGVGLNPQPIQTKEYMVSVDQNTEISGNPIQSSPSASVQAEKFSQSDLKKDLQVTIYAKGTPDNTQNLKALRIIPLVFNTGISPQATTSGTKTK